MATFTVILEKLPDPILGENPFQPPPEFHSTEAMDAANLDEAWDQARLKHYIQGTIPNIQIADIKTGEWEPPPPPPPPAPSKEQVAKVPEPEPIISAKPRVGGIRIRQAGSLPIGNFSNGKDNK